MKKNILNNKLTVLFMALILCITLLLSIVFLDNSFANAENLEENKNNLTNEIQETPAVLDNNVKAIRNLYNYDGSPDYIYVELAEGGYAIFAKGSNELLEYSPYNSVLAEYSDTAIIYGGPATFLTSENDTFKNIITNETYTLDYSNLNEYSAATREIFNIDNSIEALSGIDYLAANISSRQINENVPNVPPLDENNLIQPAAGADYIKNYEYFLADPTHGKNNGQSCTTIATQLILSYNNYYNDRRLIPDQYLNGTKTENSERNPNYCNDPMLFNRYTLGSTQTFHDYLFDKGIEGYPKDAQHKLDEYLQEQNAVHSGNINYTINCEHNSLGVINPDKVIAELDADRPVAISTNTFLNGTWNGPNRRLNHTVLAYGYQNLAPYSDGTEYLGYIVHFGWSAAENQVWTNSAWYYTYMSLNVEHTHNYKLVGAIADTGRTEYKCNTCGHRTDKAPDNVYLDITNVEKSGSIWKVSVENFTDSSVTVFYNSKMCYFSDAQNWTGLKDIQYDTLPANSTKIYTISENTSSTSIALSYIKNDVRYITYADNLNTNGSCRAMYNTKNVPSYTQHRMKIRNLGKSGDKWLIELTNYTNMHRVFEYNTRMCLENDAERWTNLLHVKKVFIPDGKSLILEISEYSMATCIAISYEERIDRSIIFAYSLSANGTMTCRESRVESVYYSENGMEIAIAGKENNTWVIEVTNVSGSLQTFEYNAKMCFEGDAANWNGLSDIRKVSMDNNIYTRLRITENGTATSIAISYMEGIYRKVIYARDLNAANRTMTVKGNVIDTTVQDSCLAAGSLITLADGSQKAVETLTGDEILLVWNMQTGTVDYAPIWFIDSTTVCTQDIINLHFSDGTSVKVIYEHGFWNCNLNKYVYMDENAGQYIGDWFNKQTVGENGDYVWEKVQLTNVTYTKEYTTAWSPVTYGHLCYFVNGMLSMPGGIDGLFNIFEVDGETMTYGGQAMANDIERYGLYTYEEFSETFDVPVEIFEAVNAKYLKISIGKGLITYADIENLIQRYSKFF